jgi:hypothetical protein
VQKRVITQAKRSVSVPSHLKSANATETLFHPLHMTFAPPMQSAHLKRLREKSQKGAMLSVEMAQQSLISEICSAMPSVSFELGAGILSTRTNNVVCPLQLNGQSIVLKPSQMSELLSRISSFRPRPVLRRVTCFWDTQGESVVHQSD